MNKLGGYVAVYRALRDHELYMRKPLEWRAIWLHLLLSVNYADNTPQRGCLRGEGIFLWPCTRQYLRGCSRQQWRRCIDWLIEAKMATREDDKIAICNYSDFQDGPEPSVKPTTPDATQTDFALQGETTTSKSKKPKADDTWLTPYGTIWTRRTGGAFPWGQAGRLIKPLLTRYTEADICAALDIYLTNEKPQYIKLTEFAQKIGLWIGKNRAPTTSQRYADNDPLVNKTAMRKAEQP